MQAYEKPAFLFVIDIIASSSIISYTSYTQKTGGILCRRIEIKAINL